MLSTASSSLTAAQKSQQAWEKKRRNNNNLSFRTNHHLSSRGRHRPLDLAWQSPCRLRLFGGAESVSSSARYQLNNNSRDNHGEKNNNAADHQGTNNNNNNNSHHQNNTTSNNNTATNNPSRKMYLSREMMTVIRSEIESMPLPASLASVALTLKSSTLLWEDDAHHNTDADTAENNEQSNNNNSSTSGNDNDDLSKYFSGITITDERNQRQQQKIQFDNICKAMMTRGNHVMLYKWTEVMDRLGEEFVFQRLLTGAADVSGEDEEDGGAAVVEKEEGGAAKEGAAVVSVTPTTTTTPSATTSKQKQQQHRHHHYRGNKLLSKKKLIPKKSHPTSPKPTHRRQGIKLKQVIHRVVTHTAKRKANMGLDAYKQYLLDKMGKSKYNRMFQQVATMSPKKDLTFLLDDSAKALEDKIQQLESSRRKTKQDELLQKAELERQARESASKLLRKLTPDEAQIVERALYGKGLPSEVLASQGADSVQRDSMQTLQPGQWLNDEVINYFLKNCLAKRDEMLCAKQPGRKRSHFFNSFFVQTMFDDKNDNFELRGRYNYKNVRRWSKKVPGKDIFNLKYIFCPINLDNMHWTSACIFMEEKKIRYFDSMGGSGRGKLKGLLQYLKDEWKAKKGGEMDVSEWELVECTDDTPRQLNGYDCGVFTCMFADFVTKDCEPVFQQQHINQCRERIALSIMKNCAIE